MRFTRKPAPGTDAEDEDDDLDDVDDLDEDEEEEAPAGRKTRRFGRREKATAPPAPPRPSAAPVAAADGGGGAGPADTLAGVPAGTARGMTPQRRRAFAVLISLFSVAAALVLFVSVKQAQRGTWLPEMPGDFGPWTAAEMPLPRSALSLLGFPPSRGRRYSNLFNERLEAHVISTATFESYTEPKMLMAGYGYGLTAEKRLPIFDKYGSARALVLRNQVDGSRLLMYYWIQRQDGLAVTRGSIRSYTDVFPRIRLGMNTVLDNQQSVIVRCFTQIHPADAQGRQARRNLNELARAVHASLLRQAKGDKQ